MIVVPRFFGTFLMERYEKCVRMYHLFVRNNVGPCVQLIRRTEVTINRKYIARVINKCRVR